MTGESDIQPQNGNGSAVPVPQASAVDHVKVRLPDFAEEYTDLWFWQVEAAFESISMTSDKKKYNTIIGQLPTRVMYKLADLRTSPPEAGQMYNTLKTRIISEFADSTQTKITKLLGELSLGDRKPSQLLSEMRSKAANTPITDELLKQLWLRNLPEQVRAIISADDKMALTTAATMADRIIEATKGNTCVSQVTTSPAAIAAATTTTKSSDANPIAAMQKQIEELTKAIRNMSHSRSRSKQRSQTPKRSSGTTNEGKQGNYDTCWWHWKYGAEARKCKEPCNFKDNQSKN